MADNSTFDITTGCDLQEVDNAVNQTQKEITQRYDFKGIAFSLEFKRAENLLLISAPNETKLQAVYDVLQSKLVRRGVPLQNLKPGKLEAAGGSVVKQEIKLQQGIDSDVAKQIVKFIKDKKLKKVQASIQADQVRVAGPSRDDLQQVMALLRSENFGIELQFGNYR